MFDLTSYTRHLGQDTTGDLLSKGIFLGQSRGYIKGMIEIAPQRHRYGHVPGRVRMLLERKRPVVTVPSLEIDQPDVRRAATRPRSAPSMSRKSST